ncbi:MAG: nucleotidyltransferase family protein, partial [bacterium]|nr:nucleotidyltransferase family protein [bacterium]
MQAVILAGGLGTRLRPLTNTTPKPMIPINGRPFLEYTIEALRWHNITHILLLTGYLGEKVKAHFGDGAQHGVSISYSHEGQPIGVGGSLRLAESRLEDNFLLLYGDVYLPINYSHFIDHFNKRGGK